jgi:hypothetical protein
LVRECDPYQIEAFLIYIMAKELPYFKFEPGSWECGLIQSCTREDKGLFIDLCSLYWSRLGELPYAFALQKLCNGNNDAFANLIKWDIFEIKNEQIIIEFLDEQLESFQDTSEKRAKAANKRWSNTNADAKAMQKHSKSNARREEKRREEKKSNIPSLTDVINYFKEKGYTEESAKKAFNYYQQSVTGSQNYWRDGKGNTIKNWKQKMIGVWFKPENELPKPKESTTFTERQYAELRKSKPTS